MAHYIWQKPNWYQFSWDDKELLPSLSHVRLKQGKLIQKISSLMEQDLKQAEATLFEEETVKTAEVEGERYNSQSVRSSIHRRLGLDFAGLPNIDQHVDGLVEVLFDATLHFNKPLTIERLWGWQAALFPTGYSGMVKILTGQFRDDHDGPMQVISGPVGLERVHFQAPPASQLNSEIELFLNWWDDSRYSLDGLLRAGVAHFYFVTIHPFDDGNGRIARALTDMALAQDDKLAKRYYSLSHEIVKQRQEYYGILEQSQKRDSDITDWLLWFLHTFEKSLETSDTLLQHIYAKTVFWKRHMQTEINSHQRKVLNKLLDAGPGQFEGGLTARKYMGMAKGVSRRTATRELQDMLAKGLLRQNEGKGRSVSYDVQW